MILYVTRETFSRYNLKMPEEMSDSLIAALSRAAINKASGDRLLEWGGKLFYFDGKKCLQVVNFASRLTFVLVNLKVGDIEYLGDVIADYLLDLYKDNAEMTKLLGKYFKEHPMLVFSRLQDKSVISQLNSTQMNYLFDGDRLWDYIDGGILHTKKLSRDINRDWLFREKVNGKTEWFISANRFEELLKARYKNK